MFGGIELARLLYDDTDLAFSAWEVSNCVPCRTVSICDLVSSGSTLFQNGLVEQEVILRSEAVLAANKESSIKKAELIDEILFRVQAIMAANDKKYILPGLGDFGDRLYGTE